jgi:two-component system response regulator HydG
MNPQRLLIVHPDPSVRALLTSMLKSLGHRIDEATNERTAIRMLEHAPADAILTGVDPDDLDTEADAMEFLCYVRRKFPGMPVLLFSTQPRAERTREAMLRGARSVLRYPMPATQLRAAVSQALEGAESRAVPSGVAEPAANMHRSGEAAHGHADLYVDRLGGPAAVGLGPSNGHYQPVSPPHPTRADAGPRGPVGAEEILGADPTLRQAVELADAIAPTQAPVLIIGERGTGKTLLARHLHRKSPRAAGPFVEVACSSHKESALEADLFGRRGVPGEADQPGRVAAAKGGTLFLDEVSALSPALQFKLLRLLRDGVFEAAGSTLTERADCRIVVGSRDDLAPLVEEEKLRPDLFYALSVVSLKLPPLRHRGGDIARLAEHFASRFARENGRPFPGFRSDALQILEGHPWTGNVLELKAAVERAVLLCRGRPIEPSHLALTPKETGVVRKATESRGVSARGILPLKEALEEPERQLILEALQALNWNRQETARVLDINRTTLYKKMKKYGLLFDEPVWAN